MVCGGTLPRDRLIFEEEEEDIIAAFDLVGVVVIVVSDWSLVCAKGLRHTRRHTQTHAVSFCIEGDLLVHACLAQEVKSLVLFDRAHGND